MYKTTLLMPSLAADNWHLLKGFVKKALDHGVNETPIEEWLRRILGFQAQLWVFEKDDVIKGVGITQFLEYNTHKTLHLVAVAGEDWVEWKDQLTVVEEFAKKHGCKALEQWGRKGWEKILPKHFPGFETVYHVMRKEII